MRELGQRREKLEFLLNLIFLTIIPRARAGYEINCQEARKAELALTNLISNKREWNNCFFKNAIKIWKT